MTLTEKRKEIMRQLAEYLARLDEKASREMAVTKLHMLRPTSKDEGEERFFYGLPGEGLKPKFEAYVKGIDEKSFRDCLVDFMKKKGFDKHSDVYKAAGVSKSVFSKIMSCSADHKPSKNTVAALSIGLRLNLEEAKFFYNSAGYHLGDTDLFDQIISFFIINKIYDNEDINFFLYEYGFPMLGEKTKEA